LGKAKKPKLFRDKCSRYGGLKREDISSSRQQSSCQPTYARAIKFATSGMFAAVITLRLRRDFRDRQHIEIKTDRHQRTGWDCTKQPLGCFASLAPPEIARFARAQNCLAAILSNMGSFTEPNPP
jgi:hypothetical protein